MQVQRKNKTLNDIVVPLMIVGTIAFSDIQVICLGTQAIALAVVFLKLFSGKSILRGEIKNYFFWSLMFALFSACSCIWSSSDNVTAVRATVAVVQGCLIGFIIIFLSDTKERFRSLITSFVICGIIICVRFFIQVPVSYWGKETRFDNFALFGSNSTAIFLAYAAGIIIYYCVMSSDFSDKSKKWYFIVLSLLFMFVAMMTGTKKGIMVFGIIVISTFILRSKNTLKLLWRIIVGVVAVLLVYYLIMNVDIFYGAIGYRFEKMVYQYMGINGVIDGSTRERTAFIQNALAVFIEHPILGVGIDGFRYVNRIQFTYSHNNYTELLANFGVVGFAIYYHRYLMLLIEAVKNIKTNQIMFGIVLAMLVADYGTVSYSSELQFIVLGFIISEFALYQVEQTEYATTSYYQNNPYGR